MGRLLPLQSSFNLGELSPLMYSRTDIPDYNFGVQKSMNMVLDEHGPISRRTGMALRWWDEAGDYEAQGRLIPFEASSDQAFIMLVTKTKILIFDRDGIQDSGNPILNYDFNQKLENWTTTGPVEGFSGSAQVGRTYGDEDVDAVWYHHKNELIINGQATPVSTFYEYSGLNGDGYYYLPIGTEELVTDGDSSKAGNFSNGGAEHFITSSFYDSNQDKTLLTISPALTSSLKVATRNCYNDINEGYKCVTNDVDITFGAASGTAYLYQQVTVDNPDNEQSLTVISLGDGTEAYSVHIIDTIGDDDADHLAYENLVGSKNVVKFTPGQATFWVQLRVYSHNLPVTFDKVVLTDIVAGGTEISFDSPYTTAEHLAQIQYDMMPGQDVATGQNWLTLVCHGVTPYRVTYDPVTRAWSGAEISMLDDQNNPVDWANNPPGCVAFHQGRQWFSGFELDDSLIVASASGDWDNFQFGAGDPADALSFKMRSRGSVNWLLSKKDLHVGTTNGENIMTSQGQIIIPADADSEEQSNYGSAYVMGLKIDSGHVWVNPTKRRVYYSDYNDDRQKYAAMDVSFNAEHITATDSQGGIIEIAKSSLHSTNVWCALDDGTVAGCLFDVEKEIIGWHKHETDGEVLSIASLREFGKTEVYALIRRTIEGRSTLLVERWGSEYLDSYIVRTSKEPMTIVDGLEHLEGRTVSVVANDSRCFDKVVEDGQITLDGDDCLKAVVGLPYEAYFTTMPVEMMENKQSIASKRKRFHKIYLRIYDSIRPVVNGQEIYNRSTEALMDTREPNESTDIQIANLGWDQYARVTVEQNLPFPLTVLGFYGELSAEGV